MRIRGEHISIVLGGNEILQSVSLDTGDNQFIGIIGPNGSGKTSLLKCIYRVLKPQGGIMFLDGRDMRTLPLKETAKKMGVVSQHNYYNFDFTVREIVLMGRVPHKKPMEPDNPTDFSVVDEALKTVEMESFADRQFSTLSGGEQQRIILARALAQQTKCLILDEPTNHLDVKHQFQLLNLLKRLNLTVIAALHDLNLAVSYCDYIYVLKGGILKGSGSPKTLLTVEFLRDIYEVDTKILEDPESSSIHILFCREET
ncbi:MAG: ABC transporter ATP-binding protein [Treponema sp.]|jgi:iron complex transport system ATP-binding protein|nr:ABC transporter ATP-binding protein [Treponema sp.]